MWWKHNKGKVPSLTMIIAVLAAAFYIGGDSPGARGWRTDGSGAAGSAPRELVEVGKADAQEADTGEQAAKPPEKEADTAQVHPTEKPIEENTREQMEPIAQAPATLPEPPEEAQSAYSCTLSISCATVLSYMDFFDAEKSEVIPTDGWILSPLSVSFEEGETVFDVLQRTCQQREIHLEYMNTPFYDSAYIEGIANLYEFDVGEQSGWVYKVNDWFPNFGCSRYQLEDGDRIDWVYTCDLGADVGGSQTE